ncbi:MAG: hypothetical protein K6F76_01200 [Clostridiales bacterium]|nr:hypothetical protein [Clostridiales bacterium]
MLIKLTKIMLVIAAIFLFAGLGCYALTFANIFSQQKLEMLSSVICMVACVFAAGGIVAGTLSFDEK